jgi:3-oxoacyl-[acyl-carrier-protein] synthase III
MGHSPLLRPRGRSFDGVVSVDRYGNTSAGSTLILVDEDRRAGRVTEGDLVVFPGIGVGNGAMNGYAAVVL